VVRVRATEVSRTGRASELSPARRAARRAASELVARAFASTGTSNCAFATALSVGESAVRAWKDPGDPAAMTIGDLMAGSRRVRAAVAHLLLALDRPAAGVSPAHHGLLVAETVSAVCGALREVTDPSSAGGARLTREERRRVRGAVERARAELDSLERDLDEQDGRADEQETR